MATPTPPTPAPSLRPADHVQAQGGRGRRLWMLGVLSLLMGFAAISTDVYLPAMPAMAKALHVGADMMAWTVSTFLIGFSLGQLFWGPLSDRLGRRLPVALGLMVFMVGSAGCALAGSAIMLIAARMVQALGAAAGVVLSRAMVRDLYAGHRGAAMLSTLITVMAAAPLLGPLVGAQVLAHWGWRAIFWALVGIGAATLAALVTLPETHATQHRETAPLTTLMARYGQLATNPALMAWVVSCAFYYAGLFAYVAGSPFAYISFYHVAPENYGWLFGAGVVAMMVANTLNTRLLPRWGHGAVLKVGAGLAALSGLALVVQTATGLGGLAGLVAGNLAYQFCSGLVIANAIAGALEGHPRAAGAVSALSGAFQYGSGMVGTALLGWFANGTPQPMAWLMGLGGVGCLACALLVKAQRHPGSGHGSGTLEQAAALATVEAEAGLPEM
ncbi:multidrug effflux MFS transporter [Formicincola oecophyllae]|uniref:Bcr/CflA family efflux transporter n=1 Tax=Formicincola oecophyllae TaxID=2558361 RepID=A0A4Y6UA36_9PROT|nr:multidrug effflux MFS transporter [Formicincola oecophyllae]QDH14074.1 multidrug effflux MFS transporter [Formicincola oecophyllae]